MADCRPGSLLVWRRMSSRFLSLASWQNLTSSTWAVTSLSVVESWDASGIHDNASDTIMSPFFHIFCCHIEPHHIDQQTLTSYWCIMYILVIHQWYKWFVVSENFNMRKSHQVALKFFIHPHREILESFFFDLGVTFLCRVEGSGTMCNWLKVFIIFLE